MGYGIINSSMLQEALDSRRSDALWMRVLLIASDTWQFVPVSRWKLFKLLEVGQFNSVEIGGRRPARREAFEALVEHLEGQLG